MSELTIESITRSAALLKWKRTFGPFIKCPECYGLLICCDLCKGKGEVIQEDIDQFNNPVSKFMREGFVNPKLDRG